MAETIFMPKLGATMEEGTIVSWMIEEGGFVEEGDPIAEIQTDKIILELEAETSGYLLKQLYPEGTAIGVNEPIGYLGEEGESIDQVEVTTPTQASTPKVEEAKQEQSVVSNESSEVVLATPAARKEAARQGIDLANVKGSGPRGRVHLEDVAQQASITPKMTPLAQNIVAQNGVDVTQVTGSGHNGKITKRDVLGSTSTAQEEVKTPFKGIRKVVADNLSKSFYTAPHVTLHSEVDMTNCVKLRTELLPVIEKRIQIRVSYNDLIIKACALALEKHPNINVSLIDDHIVQHADIHVGFAVDTENSLVVPVIQHANELSIQEVMSEARELIQKSKENKLTAAHMQGSTFTVSNLGKYAIQGFTPIINQPNAAILGVGTIEKKPKVVGDEIAIRDMMTLSLSFDHRLIDGAPAAAFISEVKNLLEEPLSLLV